MSDSLPLVPFFREGKDACDWLLPVVKRSKGQKVQSHRPVHVFQTEQTKPKWGLIKMSVIHGMTIGEVENPTKKMISPTWERPLVLIWGPKWNLDQPPTQWREAEPKAS